MLFVRVEWILTYKYIYIIFDKDIDILLYLIHEMNIFLMHSVVKISTLMTSQYLCFILRTCLNTPYPWISVGQAKWYYYVLLGVVDVEANFLGENYLQVYPNMLDHVFCWIHSELQRSRSVIPCCFVSNCKLWK